MNKMVIAGGKGGHRSTRVVHTTNNSRKSRRDATSENGGTYFNTSMKVLHIGSGVGRVKEAGREAGEVKVETAAMATKM
jgi:hypothetical protein